MTLVSVIMPAFNAARYITAAIDSIRAQDVAEIEIIVIDDGSRDETRALVERATAADPRVRLVAVEHAGVSAARNRGLEAARGQIVAFLDADDLWPPGRLARHLRFLAEDAGCALCSGTILVFSEEGEEPPPLRSVNLGAMTMRRALFRDHGGFDPSLRFFEDLDLLLRLHDAGVPIRVEDPVALLHRRHEGNMSRDIATSRQDMVRVLRNGVARRRSSSAPMRPFPFTMPSAETPIARLAVTRAARSGRQD